MSADSSDVPKPKHSAAVTWGPLAAILVTIITYFASQILAGVVFGVVLGFLNWPQERMDEWLNTTFAQFLIMTVSAIASLLVLKIFLDMRKASFRSLGFARRPDSRDLLYALVGFAVYFGLLIATSIIASGAGLNTEQEQNIGFESAKETQDQLILVFISLVVLPPIVEEILFRGFLFGGLRKKLNFVVATLITSVLFAVPHLLGSDSGLLWIAAVDTFVLSLVLCYMREKTGALWASISIHALKNGLAFVFLFVAVQ